jgi:hypothetical protein
MDENKQNNTGTEQTRSKTDKKINRDILKWIIVGLAGFVVVFLIFGVGMFVGGMKARFSYRWAESYHKNFAGPQGGFFGNWRAPLPLPGDFIEGHGTFGEIIKINDSDLVVKGRSDVEKIILITKDTIIEKGKDTIKKEELKVGDQIVIIGSPNEEGQIEAKLIRVFSGEEKEVLLPTPPRSLFFR